MIPGPAPGGHGQISESQILLFVGMSLRAADRPLVLRVTCRSPPADEPQGWQGRNGGADLRPGQRPTQFHLSIHASGGKIAGNNRKDAYLPCLLCGDVSLSTLHVLTTARMFTFRTLCDDGSFSSSSSVLLSLYTFCMTCTSAVHREQNTVLEWSVRSALRV